MDELEMIENCEPFTDEEILKISDMDISQDFIEDQIEYLLDLHGYNCYDVLEDTITSSIFYLAHDLAEGFLLEQEWAIQLQWDTSRLADGSYYDWYSNIQDCNDNDLIQMKNLHERSEIMKIECEKQLLRNTALLNKPKLESRPRSRM